MLTPPPTKPLRRDDNDKDEDEDTAAATALPWEREGGAAAGAAAERAADRRRVTRRGWWRCTVADLAGTTAPAQGPLTREREASSRTEHSVYEHIGRRAPQGCTPLRTPSASCTRTRLQDLVFKTRMGGEIRLTTAEENNSKKVAAKKKGKKDGINNFDGERKEVGASASPPLDNITEARPPVHSYRSPFFAAVCVCCHLRTDLGGGSGACVVFFMGVAIETPDYIVNNIFVASPSAVIPVIPLNPRSTSCISSSKNILFPE